jgi:UDP-N-acetylmuramate--alanine ligase
MVMKNIDLKRRFGRVYMIGIKGVGMTMLAQFLVKDGSNVSGSDIAETFLTDQVLKKERIKVAKGFAVSNLPKDCDAIIY